MDLLIFATVTEFTVVKSEFYQDKGCKNPRKAYIKLLAMVAYTVILAMVAYTVILAMVAYTVILSMVAYVVILAMIQYINYA